MSLARATLHPFQSIKYDPEVVLLFCKQHVKNESISGK